jgi:hypothetical protein
MESFPAVQDLPSRKHYRPPNLASRLRFRKTGMDTYILKNQEGLIL